MIEMIDYIIDDSQKMQSEILQFILFETKTDIEIEIKT